MGPRDRFVFLDTVEFAGERPRIADADRGVLVVLADENDAAGALDRLAATAPPAASETPQAWRQHGIGAQILADLGVSRLTVLGTKRRFLGLSGFGIEIVGYESVE